MAIKNLDDLIAEGVEGRNILVRSDFNVPIKDGEITDPGRIDASIPTIKALRDAGARVILAAHLGRPDGKPDAKFSLAPVAEALSERLDQWVPLAADITGEDAHERANGLNDGDVLLLENVRFDPRETSKDDSERETMGMELVSLTGDNGAFVSDGFGVVHRKQASVYDVAKNLPHYAGYLVQREVSVLDKLAETPDHPYAVALGGSKVSDKLGVIESLAPKVDKLLIGGGMAYTFLKAKGYEVGKSLLEESMVEKCSELLSTYGEKIVLPVDIVIAQEFAADADHKTVPADQIPSDWEGLDSGPESSNIYGDALKNTKTIFWNGPFGVFEFPAFSKGTKSLAENIIEATANGAFSVVGGGDSAASVRQLGLDENGFSHISTGGGASLEFLEGKELPGLQVLVA